MMRKLSVGKGYITDCGYYDFSTILWKINSLLEKYGVSFANASGESMVRAYDMVFQVPGDGGNAEEITFRENSHSIAYAFMEDGDGKRPCCQKGFMAIKPDKAFLYINEDCIAEEREFRGKQFLEELEKSGLYKNPF